MDKQTLQQIRIDMNAALQAVAKKHNLKSLNAGNCSFDPSGCFTFKVDGIAQGGVSKDGARYNNERHIFGLPPLGTRFLFKGETCVINGMTSGGKVIFERGGKLFTLDVDGVKRGLAK